MAGNVSAPTPLDLAASINPDVFRDVFFDDDKYVNWGKLKNQANQSYGRIGFAVASTEFRVEATKDGAGAYGDLVMRTGGVDTLRLLASGGATLNNHLLIGGAGTALYLESNDGSTAAVSGATTGRLRYANLGPGKWQVSTQTSAYSDIATAVDLTAYALLAGRAGTANDLTIRTDGTGIIRGSAAAAGGLDFVATSNAADGGFRWYTDPTTLRMEFSSTGILRVGESGSPGFIRVSDGIAGALGLALSVESSDGSVFTPGGLFAASNNIALYNSSLVVGSFSAFSFYSSSASTTAFQLAGVRRAPGAGLERTDLVGSFILPGAGVPFRAFTFHGTAGAFILGSAAGPVGTELLRVQGDARIEGKLTVTGAIDPTSVLLSDPAAGTALFFESNNGATAPVSGAATGRLRYNNGGVGTWQVSMQTSAYSDIITAATLPVTAFVQNGNSFGALATLGTNDAFALAFETVGIERARILTNGRFGMGVTTPTASLHVRGTLADFGAVPLGRFELFNATGNFDIDITSGVSLIATLGAPTVSGSIKWNTGLVDYLTIDSTKAIFIRGANESIEFTNTLGLKLLTGNAAPIIFYTTGFDRGRILSTGEWIVGATTGTQKLNVFSSVNAASGVFIQNTFAGASATSVLFIPTDTSTNYLRLEATSSGFAASGNFAAGEKAYVWTNNIGLMLLSATSLLELWAGNGGGANAGGFTVNSSGGSGGGILLAGYSGVHPGTLVSYYGTSGAVNSLITGSVAGDLCVVQRVASRSILFSIDIGTSMSFSLRPTEAVFNDSSADYDFRVESDADANMLFSDAGNSRFGIRQGTPTSTLHLGGSLATPVKRITVADTPYTVLETDHVIEVNATGGAVTVNLPAFAGVAGREYHVKKVDSSANAVTIDASGAETIDGATTVTIASQHDSYFLKSGTAEWILL